LRETIPSDLETLFHFQADDAYGYQAAFMNEKWKDKEAYIAKWNKLLAEKVIIQTIVVDGKVAGSVFIWHMGDEPQISYGIGREYWNKGIATTALQQFLASVPLRPLYGRLAYDNIGSARVLEKCGFKKIGEDRGYAFTRNAEILEFVFLLEG
jgi:RimJ/RimL family protein N-acetyltransferase